MHASLLHATTLESFAGSPEELMDSLGKRVLKDFVMLLATKPAVLLGHAKKKEFQFNTGNCPPWWPQGVPFIGYSEQTIANLKLLAFSLLALAQKQPGLDQDFLRVLYQHHYK